MSEIHSPAIVEHAAGRILLFDSATFVEAYVAANPCRDDVVVASSYAGVLCAKMIVAARSRAVIGLDCNIGKDGAGIAGHTGRGVISAVNKKGGARRATSQRRRETDACLTNVGTCKFSRDALTPTPLGEGWHRVA